jgi:endoglycosylceramidase
MNVIRLGVMWPGVEPKRGEYDEKYLETMKWIVDKSAEYGIYTMVDFH